MEKHQYEVVSQHSSEDSESGRRGRLGRGRRDVTSNLAVLLSVFTCILVVICLLTTIAVVQRRQANVDNTWEATLIEGESLNLTRNYFACVPCNKLLFDPAGKVQDDPLLKQLTIEMQDGRETCCASTGRQITALFESVARLNAVPESPLMSANLSDFQFSPVSAHKRLYPERVLRGEFGIPEIPNQSVLCEFKPDDPRYGLEHTRGVIIHKRGVEIQYGGLYYVYISIHFRPQSLHPCREFRFQKFSAYLEKVARNRHASENLLHVSYTCCDSCINTQDVRFTGGIFILQKGDVIRVKVDSFELVQFSIYTSFAGLTMLGNSISQTPGIAEKY